MCSTGVVIVNFFKLFLYDFSRTFELQEKRKLVLLDTRFFDLFFRIMFGTIFQCCNKFWCPIVFFLLTLQKITLSNIGEYFFHKNSKILRFNEVYIRNPKLIWSLLVIRFSKIFYSTQWAYLLVYYQLQMISKVKIKNYSCFQNCKYN